MSENNGEKDQQEALAAIGIVIVSSSAGTDMAELGYMLMQQFRKRRKSPPIGQLAFNSRYRHDPATGGIAEWVHQVEMPRGVEEGDVLIDPHDDRIIVTAVREPIAPKPEGDNFSPDENIGITDVFQCALLAYPDVSVEGLSTEFNAESGIMTIRISVPEGAYGRKPEREDISGFGMDIPVNCPGGGRGEPGGNGLN